MVSEASEVSRSLRKLRNPFVAGPAEPAEPDWPGAENPSSRGQDAEHHQLGPRAGHGQQQGHQHLEAAQVGAPQAALQVPAAAQRQQQAGEFLIRFNKEKALGSDGPLGGANSATLTLTLIVYKPQTPASGGSFSVAMGCGGDKRVT